MWPNSGFAAPVSSFQRPVPLVLIDPDAEPLICVKFNEKWLAYIIGSLQQLLLQTTWKTSSADELNRAQGQAFTLINQFSAALTCAQEAYRANGGVALEDSLSSQIRVNPDDPCIIQMWCIDHWENWYDPRNCTVAGVGQPQPGGTITVQECKDAVYTLSGRDRLLVPFPVDDGYTITIEDASGGWWDGDNLAAWQCPSGYTYALGACASIGSPNASGPIPALPYGRLIAQVGNAYLDAFNTTITIPVGTGAIDMYLQMNDDDLSDNSGSITFKMTVCNAEKIVSQVTIDVASSTPVSAGFTSEIGTLYKLTCTGVGNSNGVADGADFFYTYAGGHWQYVDQHVKIDGADPGPVPAFASDHEYTVYIQGTGAAFEFVYYDDNYFDNSGSLSVVIEVA